MTLIKKFLNVFEIRLIDFTENPRYRQPENSSRCGNNEVIN